MTFSDSAQNPPQLHSPGHRLPVEIAAYVRLSFNEEVELNGWVGELTMTGESRKRLRQLTVATHVDNQPCTLRLGLRRLRAMAVSGQVMGQPVTGHATVSHGGVDFEGVAGQEPLRYRIDSSGGCTTFGHDLGITVTYQAFYSEIRGSVDRAPDAVMIGLLLPLVLRLRANALG